MAERVTAKNEENSNEDEAFKRFIREHLVQLLEKSILYVNVIAYLTSNGILYDEDDTHLKSIKNESEKKLEFYKIIQKRSNCYNHLLKAFTGQTGVLEVLRRFEDPNNLR